MKNINQCINYDKQEAHIQNKHVPLKFYNKFNITKIQHAQFCILLLPYYIILYNIILC